MASPGRPASCGGGVAACCRAACLLRRHATVADTHGDKVIRFSSRFVWFLTSSAAPQKGAAQRAGSGRLARGEAPPAICPWGGAESARCHPQFARGGAEFAKHRPQFVRGVVQNLQSVARSLRGVVRSLPGVRSLVCALLFRGCTPTSAASQKVWVL